MKGELEKMLACAREMRSEYTAIPDLIAATTVVHQIEEWLAKTIEHLAALKAQRGWDHLGRGMADKSRRRSPGRPDAHHPVAHPAVASALTAALVDADRRTAGRRPPAEEGDALGVVGAQPPPAMGHGWPASPGAGSAAGISPEAGNASQLSRHQGSSPGDAFFRPVSERISR
jgi:hypothetical protein